MYTHLLYSTNNPFINLAFTFYNQHLYIDSAAINLFSSLLESNLYEQHNVNEKFYTVEKYEENIREQNIFSVLSNLPISHDLEFKDYKKFFEFLWSKNIKIEEQNIITNKKSKIKDKESVQLYLASNSSLTEHPIFSSDKLSERSMLFFMQHLIESKQLSQEEFYQKIEQHHTYHHVIDRNYKDVMSYFASLQVNPNFTDEESKTPLMHCDNFDTLKLFSELNNNINWLHKNDTNQDSYSIFLDIKNTEDRKNMLQYAKEHMDRSINNSLLLSEEKSSLISERNRQQLLEMVITQKTKKEISQFIKSNNISEINHITDNEGNNLLMICLKQNSWSKANLFLNYCDISSVNNKQEDGLSIILQKSPINLPRIEQIFPILNIALAGSKYKEKEQSLFLYLLQQQIINNEYITMPEWMVKENTKYLESLGFSNTSSLDWQSKFKYKYNTVSVADKINFFLEGFSYENKQFNFDFNALFEHIILKKERDADNSNAAPKYSYLYDASLFNQILNLFYCLDTKNIDYQKEVIMEKLHDKCISMLNEGYHNHYECFYGHDIPKDEIPTLMKNRFVRDCIPLIQHFVKNNNVDILTKLDDGIINYNDYDENMKKTMNYILLLKKVNDTTKTIKRSKI